MLAKEGEGGRRLTPGPWRSRPPCPRCRGGARAGGLRPEGNRTDGPSPVYMKAHMLPARRKPVNVDVVEQRLTVAGELPHQVDSIDIQIDPLEGGRSPETP